MLRALRICISPRKTLFPVLPCRAITTLENFCYIELALTFPEMGGEYIYIKKGFGDLMSFLFVWVYWVFMTSASSAIIALTFAAYFCQMFWTNCSPPQEAKAMVAASAMTLLTGLQCINPKFGERSFSVLVGAAHGLNHCALSGYMTSNVFAIAKLSGLFLIIVVGLGYIGIVGPDNLEV